MLTPVKAIRENCIRCCAHDKTEVKNCLIDDCPLWPYRMGKNPNRKLNLTEEQRQERFNRMHKEMK